MAASGMGARYMEHNQRRTPSGGETSSPRTLSGTVATPKILWHLAGALSGCGSTRIWNQRSRVSPLRLAESNCRLRAPPTDKFDCLPIRAYSRNGHSREDGRHDGSRRSDSKHDPGTQDRRPANLASRRIRQQRIPARLNVARASYFDLKEG